SLRRQWSRSGIPNINLCNKHYPETQRPGGQGRQAVGRPADLAKSLYLLSDAVFASLTWSPRSVGIFMCILVLCKKGGGVSTHRSIDGATQPPGARHHTRTFSFTNGSVAAGREAGDSVGAVRRVVQGFWRCGGRFCHPLFRLFLPIPHERRRVMEHPD